VLETIFYGRLCLSTGIKKTKLFAVIVFITAILFGQTKIFAGAWFQIKYPSTFTPVHSLISASSQQGYEKSAFFKSPMGWWNSIFTLLNGAEIQQTLH
jgi:hypothetical protein